MLECNVEIDSLSYTRADKIIFSGITCNVCSKQLCIISGKNGAGKTTLIRVLAGVISPHSGIVTVGGFDRDSDCYYKHIIYVGHQNSCSSELSVIENILFWSGIYNTYDLVDPCVLFLGLTEVLNIKFSLLSVGWKRRIALSRLMIANKRVWLIDEPFVNLDNQTRSMILSLIRSRLETGGIVFVTDHSEKLAECFENYIIISMS